MHPPSLALFWTFVCVALISLSACDEKPKPMGFPPAVVQVAPVTLVAFKEKSDFLGTMKSRKSVTLSPNVVGHILRIQAHAGELVHSGELVMEIDSGMQSAQADAVAAAGESAQSDVSSAKATLSALESSLKSKLSNVEYTNAQHDRYATLQKEGAVSHSELDSWKNNYSTAQSERDATKQQIEAQKMVIQKLERTYKQALANLKAQKEQLKYYAIRAPFTGVIGDIPVKVGDHVTTTTALTTLTENHPLEVYISIPAEKASGIHAGTVVTLKSTDGSEYGQGEVIFIAPTVDPSSQTVLVKALYQNSKSELRADQTVKAQIVWQVLDGISVPTKAVSQSAGKYFVFVAETGDGGKLSARQAEIEIYGIEGSEYQVKSGLKRSDRIVTTGIQRLADGAPIVAKSESSNKNDSTAQSSQKTH